MSGHPSIAILGPGGVGGFLAAALERAGIRVTLIAREQTAQLITRDGVDVRSVLIGDRVARPRAVSTLNDSTDVLVIATKATGLDAALERVSGEPKLVVPLLNGRDHIALLRERFGSRAVAATIRIEADRPAPGRVVQTSPFLRVDLASDDPGPRPELARFAQTLEAAEIPVVRGSSEAAVIWGKLVRLNALACTTSAYDTAIGPIRSTAKLRRDLEGCVAEAAAVAGADGAPTKSSDVLTELDSVHETLGSSMQRDIAAGREPELDAIPGAVLRSGDRHGLECPTIERLATRIAQRAGVAEPRR